MQYFRLAFVVGLVLAGCSASAPSQGERYTAPGFEKWVEGNTISIAAVKPESGETTSWRYEILGPGDARVIQSRTGQQPSTVLLYGGKILATKNLPLKPGTESDAIDAPAMMVNLLFELLARALPQGPQGIEGEQTVNFSQRSRALVVATDSAYAVFQAPWSVRGVVTKTGANQVRYELNFAFATGKGEGDFDYRLLRGEWQVDSELKPLDPQLRLAGYDVFLLSPRTPEGRPPAERLTNMGSIDQVLSLLSARERTPSALR